MKKFLLATAAIAALAAARPASAADFGYRAPYRAPAYAAPPYSWTGFYLGAHVGGAFSSDHNFNGLGTGNNGNGRVLGGFQAGADWQFNPNWVVGLEGQYSWLSGSVGYTWGPGLLYVKGGYAYSDNNETVTLGGVPIAFAISGDHRNGYTIGAGVEYMFAPNWSAKVEYQYYNFGSANFTAPAALIPTGSFTTDDNVFKVGVNYRINWAGPVTARY
jgi:outer membrane immunogenic protein